ncbi:FKBP-type peptidyl-prolyl cis-trans isomerase [Rhodohalobacter sp.]|uniref:FKBP-type peptidyl-prolyl cis-trans isomerase n=1 Tax=Rhodohalobacter sp. TaxID=1974210 RepID=UPI003567A346
MKINYRILPLLFVALLTTGCLSDPGNPFGEPVDETEFLEENAQKEGVTVTPSGLQYRVIEESEGEIPYEGAVVFLEYEGRLINDEVFVRTPEPDYFALTSDVLTGIYEGVQLMGVGSEYEFVIPPELGYGDNPPQGSPIRPGSVLIFDMTLDSFLQRPNEFLADNAEREDVQVTESGLQYRVIEQGDGSSPDENSLVRVNYTGTFTNGYVFDESPAEGSQFQLQGVVPGFSEGIQLMQEGAIYELFVPADIGYGDSPPQSIPEGAVLIFEVELLQNAE